MLSDLVSIFGWSDAHVVRQFLWRAIIATASSHSNGLMPRCSSLYQASIDSRFCRKSTMPPWSEIWFESKVAECICLYMALSEAARLYRSPLLISWPSSMIIRANKSSRNSSGFLSGSPLRRNWMFVLWWRAYLGGAGCLSMYCFRNQ